MSFPTELPRSAIGVILDAFKVGPDDAGRLALAAYELVGYGAYLAFGDVKYLMNADPTLIERIQKILESLNLDDLPKYAEVVAYVADLLAKGYRWPRIILSVTIKFGPQIAAVAARVYMLLRGF